MASPISVITHTDPVTEYKYLLKSLNDPPQIRVVVPGLLDRISSRFLPKLGALFFVVDLSSL